MGRKRPLSISVIGWYVIFTGLSLALSLSITLLSPQVKQLIQATGNSYYAGIAISALSLVVHLSAGIAILKGHNWGRLLYMLYNPIVWMFSWAIAGFKLTYILGIAIYCVVVFFFIKPETNKFFLRNELQSDQTKIKIETKAEVETETQTEADDKMGLGLTIRKIIGGGLATFGIFFFLNIVAWIIVGTDETNPFSVLIGGLLMVIGLILFVIPSIFIWERKRWRKLLGLCLIVVGAMSLMAFLSITSLVYSDDWKRMMEASQQLRGAELVFEDQLKLFRVHGIGAIIIIPIGIMLLKQQNKIDKGLPR